MSSALIGHTGFVGGNLLEQRPFTDLYNSTTIDTIAGRSFDTLVFSGAQARKWWANLNPGEDWKGIARAIDAMSDVRAGDAVLISTVDVLPGTGGLDESFSAGPDQSQHSYGAHRLRLEDWFSNHFSNALIVRLPALFGRGLKKNVIYDLLHNNGLDKVNSQSVFQYYDLSRLAEDIAIARSAGLRLVHLFPQGVRTRDVIDAYFPDRKVGADPAPPAVYDFRTRHADQYGGPDGYLYSADDVMQRLGRFLDGYR